MWAAGTKNLKKSRKPCTRTNDKPVTGIWLGNKATATFKPIDLKLRPATVYEFKVDVRAGPVKKGNELKR